MSARVAARTVRWGLWLIAALGVLLIVNAAHYAQAPGRPQPNWSTDPLDPYPIPPELAGVDLLSHYVYQAPKNPVNDWLVAEHQKRFNAPPDFFTAGGFASAMAVVAAVNKAKSLDTEKLIAAMEGLEFDTPKGKMAFRKEDHQALQAMYHFKIKADPSVAWGIPELVRELKIEDMQVPIQNKR